MRRTVLVPIVVALLVVGGAGMLLGRAAEPAHSHGSRNDDTLFNETPAQTITMTLTETSFTPATVRAAAGSLIELSMENAGVIDHDFTIKQMDVDQATRRTSAAPASHQHLDGFDVHVALGAKQSAQLRLHLHEKGVYRFLCTVLGHEQAGMHGTLIVE